MKTTKLLPEASVAEFHARERVARDAVAQREQELEAALADRSVPAPVAEGSEVLDGPTRQWRVGVAESNVVVAQRRVQETAAESERARARLATATQNGALLDELDRALEAAIALDSKAGALVADALQKLAAMQPELHAAEQAALTA